MDVILKTQAEGHCRRAMICRMGQLVNPIVPAPACSFLQVCGAAGAGTTGSRVTTMKPSRLGSILLLLAAGVSGQPNFAQDTITQTNSTQAAPQQPRKISAHAFGTGTQMGSDFSVNINIDSYSTQQDQQAILQAFRTKGMTGLWNVVDKMKTKGRITVPGKTGWQVTYIIQAPTPTGVRIRMLTTRPIYMAEVMGNTRTQEYSVSAVELDLDRDKDKSKGTLIPLCKFKVNKEKQLEVEAYKFPWRLANLIEWEK
jgi:hypothetical protein